jgi:hypothetical protein
MGKMLGPNIEHFFWCWGGQVRLENGTSSESQWSGGHCGAGKGPCQVGAL